MQVHLVEMREPRVRALAVGEQADRPDGLRKARRAGQLVRKQRALPTGIVVRAAAPALEVDDPLVAVIAGARPEVEDRPRTVVAHRERPVRHVDDLPCHRRVERRGRLRALPRRAGTQNENERRSGHREDAQRITRRDSGHRALQHGDRPWRPYHATLPAPHNRCGRGSPAGDTVLDEDADGG